ncbi:hypothetical protein B0T20DRAFT_360359, partial [Sordaria brevicollis]
NFKPYFVNNLYNIKIFNKLFAYLYVKYYNYDRKEKAIYEFNNLKFEINRDF